MRKKLSIDVVCGCASPSVSTQSLNQIELDCCGWKLEGQGQSLKK